MKKQRRAFGAPAEVEDQRTTEFTDAVMVARQELREAFLCQFVGANTHFFVQLKGAGRTVLNSKTQVFLERRRFAPLRSFDPLRMTG